MLAIEVKGMIRDSLFRSSAYCDSGLSHSGRRFIPVEGAVGLKTTKCLEFGIEILFEWNAKLASALK
jgi:hypothetical protein